MDRYSSERLGRLRAELGQAHRLRDRLAYRETQGLADDRERAELAALRETEIPELEQALAEALGMSLHGGGQPRP